MIRAIDIPEVAAFLAKMDSENEQFKTEYEAEKRLADAIEHCELVFKRKITVTWKEE